jgi:hypothetical protein
MMKYLYLILMSFPIFSFTTEEKDCRHFNFGSSLQTVKSKETANFLNEEILLHNLKALTFVEHKAEASYMYTYTFHCEMLTSLKIKNMSTEGDNSFLNADENYRKAKDRYSLSCEVKIKETVGDKGLKSFQVTSPKRKIYVMMVQENQDFYLVEKFFRK